MIGPSTTTSMKNKHLQNSSKSSLSWKKKLRKKCSTLVAFQRFFVNFAFYDFLKLSKKNLSKHQRGNPKISIVKVSTYYTKLPPKDSQFSVPIRTPVRVLVGSGVIPRGER